MYLAMAGARRCAPRWWVNHWVYWRALCWAVQVDVLLGLVVLGKRVKVLEVVHLVSRSYAPGSGIHWAAAMHYTQLVRHLEERQVKGIVGPAITKYSPIVMDNIFLELFQVPQAPSWRWQQMEK